MKFLLAPSERLHGPAQLRMLLWISLCLWGLGCDRQAKQGTDATTGAQQPSTRAQLVPLTNMVVIRPGTFIRAKRRVTLRHEYWLSRYEVTQGEFVTLMQRNPSHFPDDLSRPVEKVSYYEALEYCAELTRREGQAGRLPPGFHYRLPTEAEWEYACRAGSTNFYSFGHDVAAADQFAWTLENSDAVTHPVGLLRPNAWGLYDMHGNVWEWCQDWFAMYPDVDMTDPRGPQQGKVKVFRGGSWNHSVEMARAANRFMMSPSNGIYFVGFRLALSHAE